jgi:hypothetical protein
MITDCLKQNLRCLEQPTVYDALCDSLKPNPLPMMTVLNLTVPETMQEKRAANATRQLVKPKTRQNVKPIGFEVEQTGQKMRSLTYTDSVLTTDTRQPASLHPLVFPLILNKAR